MVCFKRLEDAEYPPGEYEIDWDGEERKWRSDLYDYGSGRTGTSKPHACNCPTEPEGGCPHCGRAGPKQTTQEHRDRCHRASVGR